MPNSSKFGLILCLKDQLCVIAGVGRNSISLRFFFCGGAGIGPCNLEIHESRAILVKSADLMAIWMNKFLFGEFCVFHGK